MTAITDFFCDYCNAGAVMDDTLSGYARELAPNTPLGWWEVPKKGPGDTSGHACPECVMGDDDVRQDIARRRGAETDRLIGRLDRRDDGATPDHVAPPPYIPGTTKRESNDPAPDWPARTSPFDA